MNAIHGCAHVYAWHMNNYAYILHNTIYSCGVYDLYTVELLLQYYAS